MVDKARGFLGAGDLYIDRFNSVTQAYDGEAGPFEAIKFEIKPNSDIKEMVSRGKTTLGQVIESVPVPKPSELTVELGEVNRIALGMALFGKITTLAVGAGTLTAESINAKKGYWVQLPQRNLAAAGLVVTNTGATVTYVLGTDYVVNYRLGTIKILEASAIVDNAVLKVTGTSNAIAGSTIMGSTETQVRAKFRLDGVNFVDNSPCVTTVHEAVLTPDKSFDFLQDNFASISLKGRMKTPTGKTAPFEVELHDA